MTGLPTSSATSSAPINGNELSSTSPITTPYNPSTCLFCTHTSTDISESLSHMSKNHNFFIPDQDYLIDLSSFLSFLNTIISEFHQCLFCGSERSNKWAAQDHMKSKGHCRIDVEEEEWEDFWYFPEPEGDDVEDKEQEGDSEFLEIGGDDEIRLPSGKTLRHRSQARYFRRNPNRTALPAPAPRQLQPKNAEISTESRAPSSGSTPSASATTTSTSSDRQLVMRAGTSTSLVGLPELQVRALQTTEMKAMQMETRARNRYQAVLERGGNSQKHFKYLDLCNDKSPDRTMYLVQETDECMNVLDAGDSN